MDNPSSDGRGFRLADLLVVIIIVVIVVGLLLSLIPRARDDDTRYLCYSNLCRIGRAIQGYADNHKAALPALSSAPQGATWANSKGNTYAQSFFFTILPYLEDYELYTAGMSPATNGQTWNGRIHSPLGDGPIFDHGVMEIYQCPADRTASGWPITPNGWVGSSYAANYQIFGTENWAPKYSLDEIPDGTANTVALSERFAHLPGPGGQFTDPAGAVQQAGNLWAWPANCGTSPPTPYKRPVTQNAAVFAYGNVDNSPPYGYGPVVFNAPQVGIDPAKGDYRLVQSGHKYVITVGMCDGSARGVAFTVSQPTWQSALLPDDGLQLGKDW